VERELGGEPQRVSAVLRLVGEPRRLLEQLLGT
jgi:hypothetical protein